MWPLAAIELVRSQRDGSLWSRLHARQAVVFGALATLVFVVLLTVPLGVSLVLGNPGAIIAIYGAALAIDGLYGIAFLVLAMSYALRSARGELFDVPIAAPLSARLFPIGNQRRDGG